MIDFHSHTLPGIDDGSKSTEESIALLKDLKSQGADTVIATPHFLPDRESVSVFLSRREASLKKLTDALPQELTDSPQLLVGAEVAYYDGISRLDGLEDLCISDTKLLLLEMPMCKWSEMSIKEIINISCSGQIIPVLAHIERYMPYQNNQVLIRLLECGVLMQVNASFFNTFSTRRKALKMLSQGMIHFIGSDCHGVQHRPPFIGRAYEYIERKLGKGFIADLTDFQKRVLFD